MARDITIQMTFIMTSEVIEGHRRIVESQIVEFLQSELWWSVRDELLTVVAYVVELSE